MAANSKNKRRTTKKKKNTKNNQQLNMIKKEVYLLLLLAFSILLMISNFGFGGAFGYATTTVLFGIFGFMAYFFPVILFVIIAFIAVNKDNTIAVIKAVAGIVLFFCLCTCLELFSTTYDKTRTLMSYYTRSGEYKKGGGFIAGVIIKALSPVFGILGTYVILTVLVIICIVLITEKSILKSIFNGGSKVIRTAKDDVIRKREAFQIKKEKEEKEEEEKEDLRRNKKRKGVAFDTALPKEEEENQKLPQNSSAPAFSTDFVIHRGEPLDTQEEILFEPEKANPMAEEKEEIKELVKKGVKNPKSSEDQVKESVEAIGMEIHAKKQEEKKEYIFPPISLLKKGKTGKKGDSDKMLKETAVKLQQTLQNFGVSVTITNISYGPSVTRYELQPEQGVKVSKIVNLADDIKLNLAAADIRIEAPIPGKAAVGIEVPNKENSAVMFRDLLETKEFKEHPSNIAFAAGKDIGGKVVVTDIAKMPHLLIAGATGSGKSVCINTIIMSIIYKAHPDDVKLIMVDPKVVELSVYNGIPHLFIPVVTDPKKAAGALNWAVAEMMDRYQKFAEYNVRDLKGYNEKIKSINHIEDDEKPSKLPQIVIIVDELADLMMVAPGEVEDAICRLAQLARAAGIHLIIATQRPSVNVITGLIKANMPSRIAFSVSSGVDSRTIIDMNGAEKLLGKGDMLFYPQGYQKPARVQGAFVTDKEVSAVVDFIVEKNSVAQYNTEIEEKMNAVTQNKNETTVDSDRDVYFVDAGKFIIEKDKASIGMLQRVFKIGFNRAARIMDQLCDAGVVGEEEGTKPRKVLMSLEEFESYVEEYV